MLLRVAIDPEGLEPGQSGRGIGRAFLNELSQRSIVVCEPGGLRPLKDALAVHGQHTLNTVVLELLRNGRVEELSVAVPGLADLHSLSDVRPWKGKARLLVLADVKEAVLRDEGALDDPELCAFETAGDSVAIGELSKRWNTYLQRGTKREKVWKDVFEPFAQRRPDVVIIEREFGHVLYKDISPQQRGHGDPRRFKGPAWFLRRLNAAGVRRVAIATSGRRVREELRSPPDVVAAAIRDWPKSQGWPLRLDLHLIAGDFEHQRLLAFEGWAGCQLHQGLQTFDGTELKEGCSLSMQFELAGHVSREFKQIVRRAR